MRKKPLKIRTIVPLQSHYQESKSTSATPSPLSFIKATMVITGGIRGFIVFRAPDITHGLVPPDAREPECSCDYDHVARTTGRSIGIVTASICVYIV